jgi:murein DD-endopeptidase MepM/ murein hydrolase activator NlpD
MSPIKGDHYITQGYGLTDYAKTKSGKLAYKNFPGGIHPGIDLGTHGINLPVVSVVAGTVVRASADGGWGNHIEIQGADGWRRQYCHLSAILVKKGDKVLIGQEIGKVGTTGNSTGIHLHFGNRLLVGLHWEYRDPSNEIKDAIQPVKITSKLIKGTIGADVFAFGGTKKFHVPDMKTLKFFFPADEIQTIPEDQIVKIPEGDKIPSII